MKKQVLHFQDAPAAGQSLRVLLHTIVPGPQNTVPHVGNLVHFLELQREGLPIMRGQRFPEAHQFGVLEEPLSHCEILEDFKPLGDFSLDPQHTGINK